MNFVRIPSRSRSLFVACGWAVLVCAGLAAEQAQAGSPDKFPYEATIFTDDVQIHSGPGSRFYVTGETKKGTVVAVHRHDPGGWYMIAPPAGSFSLVRADYVKKQGPRQGVVAENNVIVRVGSQVNDHHEVEQRRLMKGDRVEILGEVSLDDHGQSRTMLKIQPPRGEFRWVKGDYIVPVDPALRKVHDADPYAVPSNGVEVDKPEGGGRTPDLRFPIAKGDKGGKGGKSDKRDSDSPSRDWNSRTGVVGSGYDDAALGRDRKILDALDRNFRTMIQQDISTWKLTDLSHDYRKLQKTTQIDPIANQVDLRLQAMERYRKIKAEYDDLVKLTSGTERRDAQLATLQAEVKTANQFPEASGELDDRFAMADDAAGMESSGGGNFLPDLGPDPNGASGGGRAEFAVPPHQQGPRPPREQRQAGHFSGAGLVKKVGGWNGQTPPYVLVTPSDELLAYLTPGPGVNFEPLLGHSIGVVGKREYDPALEADLIIVSAFSPVRLAPKRP